MQCGSLTASDRDAPVQEQIVHFKAFIAKWEHNRFGYNRGLV